MGLCYGFEIKLHKIFSSKKQNQFLANPGKRSHLFLIIMYKISSVGLHTVKSSKMFKYAFLLQILQFTCKHILLNHKYTIEKGQMAPDPRKKWYRSSSSGTKISFPRKRTL